MEPIELQAKAPQNKSAYTHEDLQKFRLLQEMPKMHAEVTVAYQEAKAIADKVEIMRGAFCFEIFILDQNDNPNNLVLQIVCDKHPKITRIKISDCTGITNLSPLQGLKNLQHIYIDGCTEITNEQVEALKQSLPKLKIHR